jgi:hypothetical protein
MATLTEPQKAFVVQELARFQTPSQVVAAVQAELGVSVTPSQVQAYDPTKYSGRKLSKKWREVFERTRERYLEQVSDVPLAHRGYRLQQLQELYEKARAMGRDGNVPLSKEIILEAEKIVGELYTNRRMLEHTGRGGGPIEVAARLAEVPDEELFKGRDAAAAAAIGAA